MKDNFSCIATLLLAILSIILIIVMQVAVPVFIVFLILKLCGVIAWGWFFVFLPLIVGAINAFVLIVIKIITELIN